MSYTYEQPSPHIATLHDLNSSQISAVEHGVPIPNAVTGLDGWSIRFASRCVIAQGNRIALQSMPAEGIIKIPGGGMQGNETPEESARRELIEEVGVVDPVLRLLGIVVEYRNQWKLVQISYCYQTQLQSQATIHPPTEAGSHILWADSTDAAKQLIREMPRNTYDKDFMSARDQNILDFYSKI